MSRKRNETRKVKSDNKNQNRKTIFRHMDTHQIKDEKHDETSTSKGEEEDRA